MSDDMLEYTKRFYDLQAEATKEVMKMTFFLNYGGIAATLAAFGSSAFQARRCLLILCLFIFIIGLAAAIFMALELRTFAHNIFSKARDSSANKDSLEAAVHSHRGRFTIYAFCIASLVFFGLGVIGGVVVLFNSL